DGDGRPDLVTANSNNASVSVLLNLGGKFAANLDFKTGNGPNGVALADLDNDGSWTSPPRTTPASTSSSTSASETPTDRGIRDLGGVGSAAGLHSRAPSLPPP